MVVGFDFAEDVNVFGVRGVLAGFGLGVETAATRSFENSGVVFVGGEDSVRMEFERVSDHLEQGFVGGLAIDFPGRVKDFVSAMFGVGLGEHHEFNVARVSGEGVEVGEQVVDFVFGEGETEFAVCGFECGATVLQYGDGGERARGLLGEENVERGSVFENGLRHPVVDTGLDGFELFWGGVGESELEFGGAFDAQDVGEAADVCDVGGFGGPRGDGAGARRDDEGEAFGAAGGGVAAWAVGEEVG